MSDRDYNNEYINVDMLFFDFAAVQSLLFFLSFMFFLLYVYFTISLCIGAGQSTLKYIYFCVH